MIRYGFNEYMAHHHAYMVKVATVRESESYANAAKDPNWKNDMKEEMHALMESKTWDLVDVPKGVKPIACQWVYKVKYNVDGFINRYSLGLWPRATHNSRASIMMRRSRRSQT